MTVEQGQELAREAFAEAEARRAARELARGRYNYAFRCYDCKRFVAHREATCRSCGYQHGGALHDAVPTR